MHRLVVTLLLALVLSALRVPAAVGQADAGRVYLPLVAQQLPPPLPPPPVKVVATYGTTCPAYPCYDWVRGYVQTLSSTPLYSVTLEVDVTGIPYCPPFPQPSPCPPSTPYKVKVVPALPATLPGQINPFGHSEMIAKAWASIGAVRAVAGRPPEAGEEVYHPLTVVSWHREGGHVSGIVRNDSGHALQKLHVVVVVVPDCAWRAATINTTSLQPGEATTFELDYYCASDDLTVLGQGAAEP